MYYYYTCWTVKPDQNIVAGTFYTGWITPKNPTEFLLSMAKNIEHYSAFEMKEFQSAEALNEYIIRK